MFYNVYAVEERHRCIQDSQNLIPAGIVNGFNVAANLSVY